MSGFLCFTIHGKPQGKQRARRGRGGRWYTPRETVRFERLVAAACLKAGGKRPGYCGPVELEVVCCFGDRRRRDLDNVLKAVSDAMNGIAYDDDSQIVRATIERVEGEPRTVVTVRWIG